jgi:drug/metabolite transporter (DMT)-like permease
VTPLPGIVLALVAGLVYTAASLFLKAALQRGASGAQVNLAANLGMAVMVQPLWFFAGPEAVFPPLWQPLLCAGVFLVGQAFTFAALAHGDVSVATPLLGTKILMVTAINLVLFQTPISPRWWIAAVAASISVALIAGGKHRSHHVARTVCFALGAAFCYSLTDVWVQHWAPGSQGVVFAPILFGAAGLLSLGVFGATGRGVFCPPAGSRTVLALGAAIFGLQIILFFFALSTTRDATAANIIYSSRSVWSVIAAWSAGHLLGLRDAEAGRSALLRRLAGALLLFAAILLILGGTP